MIKLLYKRRLPTKSLLKLICISYILAEGGISLVYVDNAATTKLKPQVLDKMMPYMQGEYGNPSSIYKIGRSAREVVERSREIVADAIGAKAQEIFFTSGGTESDNWAVIGGAMGNEKKGRGIVTSAIEHHAVLYVCKALQNQGHDVTVLPVDAYGLISVADFEESLKEDAAVVSVMYANNEIGTIQPIAKMAELARAKGVLFHTDAVQAVGHIPVNVDELGVDMLSLSAHKFGGPKGIGALYVRKGAKVRNFMYGGAQEAQRRAGTENVAGIVGLAEAMLIANRDMSKNMMHVQSLRDSFIEKISQGISHVRLNGHSAARLPNNANFSFEFIEGESLLLKLDMKGIAASSGSACTSGSLDPSHVLLAMGLPHEIAHGSLRITFGEENTMQEVDYIVESLKEIVQELRDMSPLSAERSVQPAE